MGLFGRYNGITDELIHGLLSLAAAGCGHIYGLDFTLAMIVFFSGWIIDLDHLLNTFIAKKIFKIKGYKGTIFSCSHGYTFKILHGMDLALIIGTLVAWWRQDLVFGTALFMAMSLHEIWDFIVYPHRWTELFLVTRWAVKFKPGIRRKGVGLIFDNNTLKY